MQRKKLISEIMSFTIPGVAPTYEWLNHVSYDLLNRLHSELLLRHNESLVVKNGDKIDAVVNKYIGELKEPKYLLPSTKRIKDITDILSSPTAFPDSTKAYTPVWEVKSGYIESKLKKIDLIKEKIYKAVGASSLPKYESRFPTIIPGTPYIEIWKEYRFDDKYYSVDLNTLNLLAEKEREMLTSGDDDAEKRLLMLEYIISYMNSILCSSIKARTVKEVLCYSVWEGHTPIVEKRTLKAGLIYSHKAKIYIRRSLTTKKGSLRYRDLIFDFGQFRHHAISKETSTLMWST